jgi:hypothetical protein
MPVACRRCRTAGPASPTGLGARSVHLRGLPHTLSNRRRSELSSHFPLEASGINEAGLARCGANLLRSFLAAALRYDSSAAPHSQLFSICVSLSGGGLIAAPSEEEARSNPPATSEARGRPPPAFVAGLFRMLFPACLEFILFQPLALLAQPRRGGVVSRSIIHGTASNWDAQVGTRHAPGPLRS